MRVLALETSGMSGSAAALEVGKSPIVVPFEPTQRSARALAPAVRKLMSEIGWSPGDVNLVAVTAGPGSFTGLRIGVTTAKTLAYALGAELVAVDTLDVLARQAPAEGSKLHTVLDAHRNELFAAMFHRSPHGRWERSRETHLIGVEAWLVALREGDVVTGPVIGKLATRLPSGMSIVPPELREPNAGVVAELAAELHAAGRRDDLWKLIPWYGRLAAAEEKLRAKG